MINFIICALIFRLSILSSVIKGLEDRATKRRGTEDKMKKTPEVGFEEIDTVKMEFKLPALDSILEYGTLKWRATAVTPWTRSDIFLRFITDDLIEGVLLDIEQTHENPWLLFERKYVSKSGKVSSHKKTCKVNRSVVWKLLAIQIWIYGRQQGPTENRISLGGKKSAAKSVEENEKPKFRRLREAMTDASAYLEARAKEQGVDVKAPSHHTLERVGGKFHLWGSQVRS